jgi:4-alpha-glucanotransferase
MNRVSLLLGIHNHQPVGNFEHVFRESYDRCYRPFMDLLADYPSIRISLHYSGPLIDWLERHEPAFLDGLRKKVENGQIELLTGGYYEPILAAIPARDGAGQIAMMTRYLTRRMGADPKGLWLAERVWEPSLAARLGASGVAYTFLDDTHFQAAGLKPESLHGYYLTEREGTTLAIFPISKRLRYLIPFRPPDEAIAHLDQLSRSGPIGITYADDGEKFGLWPGTYRWVYEQGWLKRFFSLLEQNRSWITTTTFADFHARNPPTGRIYLPTASYEEMMEWALPTEAILEREDLVERLKAADLSEAAQAFLRGGFWDYFLVKYPEINLMHKKALYVSDQLARQRVPARSEPEWLDEARRELYQAQGNDAYWHGLFGGYYLNYLRHALYQHLIKAENLIASHRSGSPIRLAETDLDRDGYPELLVESSRMNLYLKPSDGAAAIEIDYRPKAVCLTHLPMRRPEAYHKKLKTPPGSAAPASDGIPSIHDLAVVKASAAKRTLVYDRYPRWSFRDHLIQSDTTLERFEASQYEEFGGFSDQAYEKGMTAAAADKATISFHRTGTVGDLSLTVQKDYTVWSSRAELSVTYAFEGSRVKPDPSRPTSYIWGVELNLTLLAGADPKRYYRFPGKIVEDTQLRSTGVVEAVTEAHLVDEWQGFEIHLAFDPAVRLWRFPIETVSQSEEGMESLFQGSCVTALWSLASLLRERRGSLIRMEIVDR